MKLYTKIDGQIEILGVGDLVLDQPGPMEQYFEASGDILKKADVVIGQVETPHTDRAFATSLDFQAPPSKPEHLDVLKKYNFTIGTLAGNHIYDCGPYGVTDTYERLVSLGIRPVGAGENIHEAKEPAFQEVNGVRVGVLSYNAVGPAFSYATSQKSGCNYIKVYTHYEQKQASPGEGTPPRVFTFTDPEYLLMMKKEINELKKNCDVAVVALHKGNLSPLTTKLEMYERPLSQAAIDAGADIVLAHHAHQTRSIEMYKGCPIYHGLGNYVCVTYALTPGLSGSPENEARFKENGRKPPEVPHYPWTDDSRFALIARIICDKNGVVKAGFVPCYIEKKTTAPTPKTKDNGGQEVLDHFIEMNKIDKIDIDFEWSEDGTWIICK